MLLWRPTRPSGTHTKKKKKDVLVIICPCHHRGMEYKSRKSRETWSNRQVWPWSAKWSRAKANRVLPKECTGHSKHPLPVTQEMSLHVDITQMVNTEIRLIDYILCSQIWRSSIQSAKIRAGADCGSDHELLTDKFRLKLKKIGKTIRPFRYQFPSVQFSHSVVSDSLWPHEP